MEMSRRLGAALRTIATALGVSSTCIVTAGLFVAGAQAQVPSPLTRVKALDLDNAVAGRVTAYFAPNDREHALRLAGLADGAGAYFERELGVSFPLHLAVLAPGTWFVPYAGGELEPYGGPWGWVEESLMAAPASLDEGVLIFGRDRQADLRRVQFVLLHEFGHLANKRYLHPDSPRPYSSVRWFEELVATYFAYAYVRANDPEWAARSRVEWQQFVDGFTPAVVSLDWSFMRELPPEEFGRTYAWYQNLLNLRAAELYEKHGLGFLRRLRSDLPWAESGEWTTKSLLPLLERAAPGFEAWAGALERPQRSR